MGPALCPWSVAARRSLPVTRLVVAVDGAGAHCPGRTWTAADYAIRDAQLAVLGTPTLRRRSMS